MAKNHIIKSFKVSEKIKKLLVEAARGTEFGQTDLVRHLLNKALIELKADAVKAGGYDKLSLTLKEIR